MAKQMNNFMIDNWWRFSRYQIRRIETCPPRGPRVAGAVYRPRYFCIVPARGAKLVTYRPWELWESAHPLSHRRKPPYQKLLDLLHELRYQGHEDDDDPISPAKNVLADLPLTPESELLLLEWCATWGLLGVLLHRVHAVTLAPHGKAVATLAARYLPLQFRYLRTNHGWVRVAIVSQSRTPEVLIDPPLSSIRVTTIENEKISSTWAKFFPRVPPHKAEKFRYPMPLSAEFWQMYAEPVWDFLDAAIALQQALEAVRLMKKEKLPTRKSDRELLARGELCLEALERVSQASHLEHPGGVRTRLVPASLIAAFEAMALRDLKADGEGQIAQCPCGKFIISSIQHKAQYCSLRCRQRYKMRRVRAKKRSANRRQSSAHPVPQVRLGRQPAGAFAIAWPRPQ